VNSLRCFISIAVLAAIVVAVSAVSAPAQVPGLPDSGLPLPKLTATPASQATPAPRLPVVAKLPQPASSLQAVSEVPVVSDIPVVSTVVQSVARAAPSVSIAGRAVRVGGASVAGASVGGTSVRGTSVGGASVAGTSVGGTSVRGTSGSGAGPASGGSVTVRASASGSAARAGGGASVAAARAAGGRGPAGGGASAHISSRPAEPSARHERRLRRAVARLSGCLYAVDALPRQVLALRAGIGTADPLSRHAVAARLDTGVRRVARAERRGLRELRLASRSGRCQSPPAGASAPGTSSGDGALTGRPAADGALAARPASNEQPQAGGTAERVGRTGAMRIGGPFRDGAAKLPVAVIRQAAGDGAGPPLLLLLAAAFMTGFAAVWIKERRA
jgi:hypothetical protein